MIVLTPTPGGQMLLCVMVAPSSSSRGQLLTVVNIGEKQTNKQKNHNNPHNPKTVKTKLKMQIKIKR